MGIAQLAEEVAQGVRIQLELALQGAIGHPAPLAQQGNHLIHERDKVHLRFLPAVRWVCRRICDVIIS
jgi:hypothetical protein